MHQQPAANIMVLNEIFTDCRSYKKISIIVRQLQTLTFCAVKVGEGNFACGGFSFRKYLTEISQNGHFPPISGREYRNEVLSIIIYTYIKIKIITTNHCYKIRYVPLMMNKKAQLQTSRNAQMPLLSSPFIH